jgi:hypothetical protein
MQTKRNAAAVTLKLYFIGPVQHQLTGPSLVTLFSDSILIINICLIHLQGALSDL